MNLTVRIHDIEYVDKIAQGVTFSEEYNETLDSGAIRICQIERIENLRPYDDVYIYESGYDFAEYIALWRESGNLHDGDEIVNGKRIPFYRHLLVNQYSEEIVNLSEGIYSYSIDLFSETKGLEAVQVPNISVTQPLNRLKKVDIYTYLCRFVNLYSPKYKTADTDNPAFPLKLIWKYAKKYSVAPELKEIFGGVYSQDFTLSNPTLKDVLSTLMVTKDMIPYVKDNVIYAKDITKRTGTYDIDFQKGNGRINMVVGQMSSDDYCDGVRRQYTDALSQEGTCNFVEYLGFRNSGEALMSFDTMRLETAHKIYKIKRCYLNYYKQIRIMRYNVDYDDGRAIYIKCRQDITPLIKNSVEWGLLSQDWKDFNNEFSSSLSIAEMAKYKLTTVSYSIGGNTIEGWGNRYQQYKETDISVYDITKSYLENIINIIDKLHPWGENEEQDVIDEYLSTLPDDDAWKSEGQQFNLFNLEGSTLSHLYLFLDDDGFFLDDMNVQKMKQIFFEIEYSGFYDGAIIHSRDKGNDNFFQNDNQSSSLTLLEKDGFSQKEKLNRFANKTYTMKGRLDGDNYSVSNLLKLGQTGKIGADDDVIVYRREYSIFDNYILCSYAGIQDYVLKNFYTSVYAKYRTHQLMSLSESTNRAENRKVMLVLSRDKKYKDEDTFFKITDDKNKHIENKLFFSMFQGNNQLAHNIGINSATITAVEGDNENKKAIYSEMQSFTSANNLCFNVRMIDNISGGVFIKQYVANYHSIIDQPSNDNKDYVVGSIQEWYNMVDDNETGDIKTLEFKLSNRDLILPTVGDNLNGIYKYFKNLPVANKTADIDIKEINSMVIREDFYKDNKEKIDLTFQIEPIVEYSPTAHLSQDIVLGDYFTRLSDLYEQSGKRFDKDVNIEFVQDVDFSLWFTIGVMDFPGGEAVGLKVETESGILFENFQGMINAAKEDPNKEGVFSVVKHTYAGKTFDVDVVPFKGVIDVFEDFKHYKYEISNIGIFEDTDNGDNYMLLVGKGAIWENYDSNNPTYKNFYNYNEGERGITVKLSWSGTNSPIISGINHAEWKGVIDLLWWAVRNNKEFAPAQQGFGYLSPPKKSTNIVSNMFVEYNTEDYIDNTYSSKILPPDTSKQKFSGDKVAKVFELMGDGDDSYIRVHIPQIEPLKSINYWYFDFDAAYSKDYSDSMYAYNYTPEQSGYRFVFGVNVREEDIERGYVDIYITKTTHRDPRVFDSLGRQIGTVHNCVENGVYTPPTHQEYDETGMAEKINLYEVSFEREFATNGTINGEVPSANFFRTSGGGHYYDGEEATLKVFPYDGVSFIGWKTDKDNEDYISTSKEISVIVNEDIAYVAVVDLEKLLKPVIQYISIVPNGDNVRYNINIRNDNGVVVTAHATLHYHYLDENGETKDGKDTIGAGLNVIDKNSNRDMHFDINKTYTADYIEVWFSVGSGYRYWDSDPIKEDAVEKPILAPTKVSATFDENGGVAGDETIFTVKLHNPNPFSVYADGKIYDASGKFYIDADTPALVTSNSEGVVEFSFRSGSKIPQDAHAEVWLTYNNKFDSNIVTAEFHN